MGFKDPMILFLFTYLLLFFVILIGAQNLSAIPGANSYRQILRFVQNDNLIIYIKNILHTPDISIQTKANGVNTFQHRFIN